MSFQKMISSILSHHLRTINDDFINNYLIERTFTTWDGCACIFVSFLVRTGRTFMTEYAKQVLLFSTDLSGKMSAENFIIELVPVLPHYCSKC
jgi:hypothetical protein